MFTSMLYWFGLIYVINGITTLFGYEMQKSVLYKNKSTRLKLLYANWLGNRVHCTSWNPKKYQSGSES